MSSFYAYDFIFDDIPSQKFDLKIITFDDGGLFSGVGSSDVDIKEQRSLRKSKPFFLGRTQETKLEFPLTFGTARPLSAMDRDIISRWLFGRSIYKKLYILQDDLNSAYFNCFLTKPEPLYIGGLNYAFTCTVVCDSPWAYSTEKIISGSGIENHEEIDIYNNSSEDEFLYPELSFNINTAVTPPNDELAYVGVFSIINNVDEYHSPVIIALTDGDNVTLNNDLQIITWNNDNNILFPRRTWYNYWGIDNTPYPVIGDEGGVGGGNTIQGGEYSIVYGILDCFSKKWFRLKRGYNHISMNLSNLEYWNSNFDYEIKYTERLKIGG